LTEVSAQSIAEKLEEFTEAAVLDFTDSIMTDDIIIQNEVVTALGTQTQTIIEKLEPVAIVNKKSYADWLASCKELKSSIKNLYSSGIPNIPIEPENIVTNALNIARLTLRLMQAPSTAAINLIEKIKGYSALASSLIDQYKKDPFGIEKIKAHYGTANIALTGACAFVASGAAFTTVESAASINEKTNTKSGATSTGIEDNSGGVAGQVTGKNAGTASRTEAIEASNQVVLFLETVTAFQDTKISQNAFVDAAPTSHLALSELVYSSAQVILNASFSLPMQKTITLDRDRQVIELCAELYGTPDYIDDFIIENNLNMDEIQLLPMGKKVSYYVKSS